MDLIQVVSCSDSTQKGPPMRKPASVCGQRCGTEGPVPGVNLTLFPLACCASGDDKR